MKKKDFKGNLLKIDPLKIINKEKDDDLEKFFLVLGLIFNDLKGLILFDVLVRETYRIPEKNELSAHAGEYNGIRVHIHRLLIGVISEFFIFIEKNKTNINDIRFKLIVKKLSKEKKDKLNHILSIVFDPSKKKNDKFSSILARIRNNVIFHYDHSGDEMKRGFLEIFFDSQKNIFNEKALFSLGGNMEETRFYYSDASVQKYIQSRFNNVDNNDYFNEAIKVVEEMNELLITLLGEYLKGKNVHKS